MSDAKLYVRVCAECGRQVNPSTDHNLGTSRTVYCSHGKTGPGSMSASSWKRIEVVPADPSDLPTQPIQGTEGPLSNLEIRCIDCEKLTTNLEADARIFRTGHCGHCDGQLISADQCGRKSRVEGRTFLCVAERGHAGDHRYAVTVKR